MLVERLEIDLLFQKAKKTATWSPNLRRERTFELCAKCSNSLCHAFGVLAERTIGKSITTHDSVLITSSPVVVVIGGGGQGGPKKHEFRRK